MAYAIKERRASARFWLAYSKDPRSARYFLSGPAPVLGFHDLSTRLGRARLFDTVEDAVLVADTLNAREGHRFEVVRIGNGVHRIGERVGGHL